MSRWSGLPWGSGGVGGEGKQEEVFQQCMFCTMFNPFLWSSEVLNQVNGKECICSNLWISFGLKGLNFTDLCLLTYSILFPFHIKNVV